MAEAVGSLADFVRCYEPIFLYLLAKNNTAARQSEVQKLKQVIKLSFRQGCSHKSICFFCNRLLIFLLVLSGNTTLKLKSDSSQIAAGVIPLISSNRIVLLISIPLHRLTRAHSPLSCAMDK